MEKASPGRLLSRGVGPRGLEQLANSVTVLMMQHTLRHNLACLFIVSKPRLSLGCLAFWRKLRAQCRLGDKPSLRLRLDSYWHVVRLSR